jgi:hypothetical protein
MVVTEGGGDDGDGTSGIVDDAERLRQGGVGGAAGVWNGVVSALYGVEQ